MSIRKNVLLNWYPSMKKKIEKDSDNFWRRKLTLKVRNWHFSVAWFRAEVDLPKIFFLWKSAIFHSSKLPFDAEVAEKNLKSYLVYNTSIRIFQLQLNPKKIYPRFWMQIVFRGFQVSGAPLITLASSKVLFKTKYSLKSLLWINLRFSIWPLRLLMSKEAMKNKSVQILTLTPLL